jgi:uncharacterized protein
LKKVIVLGASTNPARYSNVAVKVLKRKGFEVIPIGVKEGSINGLPIIKGTPQLRDVYTISIFLRPEKQKEYLKYMLEMNPQKIIINPGSENTNFERRAKRRGIEVIRACTIEMVSAKLI